MSSDWQSIHIGNLLKKSETWINLEPDQSYQEVTVRLWGKGAVLRGARTGAQIASDRRLVVSEGQLILSRIDARNGALGIVPASLQGAVVSNDFPVFTINRSLALREFIGWLVITEQFVEVCRKASEGTTNRVRLQEERFLATPIRLPSLDEQRRIVTRLDELSAKIEETLGLRADAEKQLSSLLTGAFWRIAEEAPRRAMRDVAPLTRRPVPVNYDAEYPQIAVRSFGRGTFHKPPLIGREVTWQKPFLVRSRDILISNIKAWEGATAVVSPEDDGRVGSHRYLTCVPVPEVATSRFVCFYLLTPEGLRALGDASPGTADRNRTLNSEALINILLPTPPFEQQLWFDRLCGMVDALRERQAETVAEIFALMPSILSKAFSGEL